MNKRRLLKLADLLEADARNRRGIQFDLNTVINREKLPKSSKAVPMTCGTQACAMGLAALSGAFKRQGLYYEIDRSAPEELYIDTTMRGRLVSYDTAAEELFGLSSREAAFLFTPSRYPEGMDLTGAQADRYVAKRIRDFVAGKATP